MASYVEEIEPEESAIEQELGLLQAIYVNELEVQHDESGQPMILSVTLHPSTADNADLQYVCLTLILTLSTQYPDELPDIAIKNPRGISDEQLTNIKSQLQELASEQKGSAMLYELIEVAKEALTHNNTPHGQCVICLEDFKEGEAFTKTACYHHFHCDCLGRYIQHALENPEEKDGKLDQNDKAKGNDKQEVVCAVCREVITYDLEQLCSTPRRKAPDVQYKPDLDMVKLQKKMAALYQKQKEKGGIIDVEAESNRFLIDISVTPTLPMSSVISSATSDEKVRRTATDQKSIKEEDTKPDKSKDRRSQPRYNNSERRAADGEKRTSNSYNKSYGDRRGGRGCGSSRPASSGRYGDRQYYRSDRSNWRDDERRVRRSRDEDGSRETKTSSEAKDGDMSSKTSNEAKNEDMSSKKVSMSEEQIGHDGDGKDEKVAVNGTKEGKADEDGSKTCNSNFKDEKKSGTKDRGSGRQYGRDNRRERYYDRNDRQRFSNASDGRRIEKGNTKSDPERRRESDHSRPITKSADRDESSPTSKDEKTGASKTHEKAEILEKDSRPEKRDHRDQRERPRNTSRQDKRGQNEPRRGGGGNNSRDYRPRSDRRNDDYPRKEMGSRRDGPRSDRRRNYDDNKEKRSGVVSENEKSKPEKSSLNSEGIDRKGEQHRSGNRRNYQPRNRTDARRDRQSYDRDHGSENQKDERTTNKNLSEKHGQENQRDEKSSKLDSGEDRSQKGDAVRSDEQASSKEVRIPVASDVKPLKVKAPPGFEDFR
ncbi:uncharacterized protein [Amphiura filiformis]|uniref:uncharacterized protein n=1 Tax=Amphiura filiformis TaxID=82378 RepID=UPI003B217B78